MTEDFIGLLVSDPDKTIHASIAGAQRIFVHCPENRYGGFSAQAFATNDPRMIAALKLIGYETIGKTTVDGVERFCYL